MLTKKFTPPPPASELSRGGSTMKLAGIALAAALVASMMASPVMAAKEFGSGACTPEAGDNRVTRWTSQIVARTDGDYGISVGSTHTHNAISFTVGVQASEHVASALEEYYPAGVPRLVRIAVMGNDSKAGFAVWARDVGEFADENGVIANSNPFGNFTFTGLKPHTHYVAVLYSPYIGNLRPFSRYCFRTDRDPANPWGGYGTGCFAPYTPTVGGERQPAPRSQSAYQTCVQARNACNAASNTTWETAGNRCIPASN